MAMFPSKRLAGTVAAEEALRKSKKRKTTSTTAVPTTPDHASKSRSTQRKEQKMLRPQMASQAPDCQSKATIMPATPGTKVSPLPMTKRGSKGVGGVAKESADNAEANGGVPLKQKHQGTNGEHGRQRNAKKQKQDKAQQNQPPSTLPTEPHASFLAELQPYHDVRVLSVISSSRMEKRIKAVLEHLGGRQRQPPDAGPPATLPSAEPASGTLPASAPAVLLHARASDASKMISIVEIVKRRIREGCFDDSAVAAAEAPDERNGTEEESTKKQAKKRKQKKRRAEQRQTAWYQYNRLYDVESVASSPAVGGSDDDEDDDFEPMPKQFQEALADKDPSTITTTTYMSIVLSRVPLPVLERHPDITAQASDDTLETEYQSWISNKT